MIPYRMATPAHSKASMIALLIRSPPFFIVSESSKKTAACAAVSLPADCQPALEARAGLEPEDAVELELPDELVDRRLPVLALHFGQDQLGRIAVVEAAEVGLDLEQLSGAVECHEFGKTWSAGDVASAGARMLQSLNSGSFFATATFF